MPCRLQRLHPAAHFTAAVITPAAGAPQTSVCSASGSAHLVRQAAVSNVAVTQHGGLHQCTVTDAHSVVDLRANATCTWKM
eukprot:351965-Chlamydomonas_euryale.AAC.14